MCSITIKFRYRYVADWMQTSLATVLIKMRLKYLTVENEQFFQTTFSVMSGTLIRKSVPTIIIYGIQTRKLFWIFRSVRNCRKGRDNTSSFTSALFGFKNQFIRFYEV